MLTPSHHVVDGDDVLVVRIAIKRFDTNLSFSFRCVLNTKKKEGNYFNIAK